MTSVSEGAMLWEPSDALKRNSAMQAYMRWLAEHKGRAFDDYSQLWDWSVARIEDFWASLWEFFEVRAATPYAEVLHERVMPGANWFAGAQLNYVEQIFRNHSAARPAILFQSELQPLVEVSWDELERKVASVAAALRAMGVGRGDRVVGYVPNIPEAVIAFLGCASLGAIWSSCSPDMGGASVIDRFKQIEPKVLFATDGYLYGGKPFDRRPVIAELQRAMPTLQKTILIPYLDRAADAAALPNTMLWHTLLENNADLSFEQVPFEHPLWVLYSSGTTGLPKPIVHGHGGILLEHLKSLALHLDLKPDDRFFWFTTTGWMMWNFLVGGLLVGCTILLYDGSPAYPDLGALWSFAERAGMTFFGTSAAYISSCMKAGIAPSAAQDLRRIKGLGSTGSPLSIEGFQWAYEHIKRDLWLASVSGGTDVCTAFVGGCPLLPVYAGEIQCRCLGAAVYAFDENGVPVVGQVGEFVVTEPMPSMPLFFWNDPQGRRYRESYFEMYPRVWRHGDWVKITSHGGVIIYGRSDATINRMGIRMGTSELYRAVEDLPEVLDSLVVDLEVLGQTSYMPLFVVLQKGVALDEALKARIKNKIRSTLSARHVPDEIFAIPEVPHTLSGKKMELPIKKILLGTPPHKAANPDSMSNPHIISYFVDLAAKLNASEGGER
jgi:acetoacetyl-CoA synthetase